MADVIVLVPLHKMTRCGNVTAKPVNRHKLGQRYNRTTVIQEVVFCVEKLLLGSGIFRRYIIKFHMA